MIHVIIVEVDETVGNPDARVVRQYPVATTDTVPHALRLASVHEDGLLGDKTTDGKRVALIANRGHRLEYGNVYRTSYVLVSPKA